MSQPTKFTPGPWKIGGDDARWIYANESDAVICDINPRDPSSVNFTDEDEANADLIAAAPELYEACIEAEIVLTREGFRITAGFCHAALAKARGKKP